MARKAIKRKLKAAGLLNQMLTALDERNEDCREQENETKIYNLRLAALCILPVLLNDDPTLLYQQFEVCNRFITKHAFLLL
jgi:hypothetical protein